MIMIWFNSLIPVKDYLIKWIYVIIIKKYYYHISNVILTLKELWSTYICLCYQLFNYLVPTIAIFSNWQLGLIGMSPIDNQKLHIDIAVQLLIGQQNNHLTDLTQAYYFLLDTRKIGRLIKSSVGGRIAQKTGSLPAKNLQVSLWCFKSTYLSVQCTFHV